MTQISTPNAAGAALESLAMNGTSIPEIGWTRTVADDWTYAARRVAAITDPRLDGLPAMLNYWPPPELPAILPGDHSPIVTPTPAADVGRRRWYIGPDPATAGQLYGLEHLGPAAVEATALALLADATRSELERAADTPGLARRVAAALRAEAGEYAGISDRVAGSAVELTRALMTVAEPHLNPPPPRPTMRRRLAELAPTVPLTLTR